MGPSNPVFHRCDCSLCRAFRAPAGARDNVQGVSEPTACADCGEIFFRVAWPVCPTCNRIDPSAELVSFMRRARARVDACLAEGPAPAADLMDEPYRPLRRTE